MTSNGHLNVRLHSNGEVVALLDLMEDQVASIARTEVETWATEVERRGAIRISEHRFLEPTADIRHTVQGKLHACFPRCLRLARARRNILLVGPSGCGKTKLAEQVSEALGLPFAQISCSAGLSEGHLLGRLLPTGDGGRFEYSRSDLVRCYEEGGVFLFDELDAADANVLLVVNSALAGDRLSVPNRVSNSTARRHPDFVALAAANTHGTGADRVYVGRNQLDDATLDRFRIGQVEMDYDEELEFSLCPDDELRIRLQTYRRRARVARLRRVVSTRFLRDAYVMLHNGDSNGDVDAALFNGWSEDEIAKVRED